MKKKLLFLFALSFNLTLHAQRGQSGSCQVNANIPDIWAIGRENVIDATFKLYDYGSCTGTLINRNTNDDNLGFYFITARHCMSKDATNNDNYIDFNAEYAFAFNYQSPNGNTSSMASTNKGINASQSSQLTHTGYEYFHKSKIRLVADYFWGDFALCEILKPLPPHFKVHYAGWNPSAFYSTQAGVTPCNVANQFVGIHHPVGDIKKISGTNNLLNLTTPIATGCYTITTIIDILFGWIWGQQFSFQVLCNYVDNPWYIVPQWCHGGIEGGSSGSGLFNGNNRLIGTLSGSLLECSLDPTSYGKLRSNYAHTPVKNTLNPANDLWTDLAGMDERTIDCYPYLVLPGAIGVSGEYFPANHYQQQNHIELKSNSYITTNAPIHIYAGADYSFQAATITLLNPGFTVDIGANFTAQIAPCTRQMRQNNNLTKNIELLLTTIEVPDYKAFNVDEQKNK